MSLRNDSLSTLLITVGLTLLFIQVPASNAETLLDITLTGAELVADPNVLFRATPKIQGDALILTNDGGEHNLFEWALPFPITGDPLAIQIDVDYIPLTEDNDPTISLVNAQSPVNLAGYMRVDNNNGSLFKREGQLIGDVLPSPPIGPLGPTDLGDVNPFTMIFMADNQGGPTFFSYQEGNVRHTDMFRKFPLDANKLIHLFWGGGNDAGEIYQINSLSIRVATAASGEGLAFHPLPNCRLVNTAGSEDGGMVGDEIREFFARGEATNFSAQGGTTRGCGVPTHAEAVLANFWIFEYEGDGFLRVSATDKVFNGGASTLIHYNNLDRESVLNATIVDLCDNNLCTSDFQVQARGDGKDINMVVNVMGYFAPIETGTSAAKSEIQELRLRMNDLEAQNQRLEREVRRNRSLGEGTH